MKRISSKTAKEMMTNQKVVILDVRTPSEFIQGHVPKAINIPLGDISPKISDIIPDKDATYLVYCESGIRSITAAKQMEQLGYANVYEFGGLNNWPYDIER